MAWFYLFACWSTRAFGSAALLSALGLSFSPEAALAVICLGAAAGVIPITSGGAVVNAGAAAAILLDARRRQGHRDQLLARVRAPARGERCRRLDLRCARVGRDRGLVPGARPRRPSFGLSLKLGRRSGVVRLRAAVRWPPRCRARPTRKDVLDALALVQRRAAGEASRPDPDLAGMPVRRDEAEAVRAHRRDGSYLHRPGVSLWKRLTRAALRASRGRTRTTAPSRR